MSSELEIQAQRELDEYAQEQAKIISMHAKGYSEWDIKRETGLTLQQIRTHLADFKDFARNDKYMAARSREVVLTVDQHYSDILKQMYEAVEEAQINGDYKARIAGLKDIAKIENDRVSFLQKAGLVADNHVGDMIAQAEEQKEILVGILKNIAKKYPDIAREIASELSRLTGTVEAVRVDG